MARVAVVEDDGPVRQTLAEVLRDGLAAEVDEFTGGAEFVASLAHQVPDVLVLDLMMPHPNGWDVLHLLDSRPEWRAIPVVVVSALDRPREHVERRRVAAVLGKPLDSDGLLRAVQERLAG